MQCPKCPNGLLVATQVQAIEVDRCKACGGIWFDNHELVPLWTRWPTVARSKGRNGCARPSVDALADPEVVGGRFDVHVDAPGWPFRAIGTLMNVRSRLTGIATGDQGIFVRRAVFEAIGGYPEWDLMEDLEFSRQLKRAGKIACLRGRVKTSARRWQKHGITKTILLMWGLRLCHFLGISPAALKPFYADTR